MYTQTLGKKKKKEKVRVNKKEERKRRGDDDTEQPERGIIYLRAKHERILPLLFLKVSLCGFFLEKPASDDINELLKIANFHTSRPFFLYTGLLRDFVLSCLSAGNCGDYRNDTTSLVF